IIWPRVTGAVTEATTGPPVNGGGQRWPSAENGGQPLVNGGQPLKHRRNTAGPPFNGGQWWWLTGSWAGSGRLKHHGLGPQSEVNFNGQMRRRCGGGGGWWRRRCGGRGGWWKRRCGGGGRWWRRRGGGGL
ncbi:hypothetical protein Tco_1580004, partial [Tanacetum coccineum]